MKQRKEFGKKGLGKNVEISTSKQRRKVEYNKQVNEQGLEGKLKYGGGVKRHPTDLFKHRLITQHILPGSRIKIGLTTEQSAAQIWIACSVVMHYTRNRGIRGFPTCTNPRPETPGLATSSLLSPSPAEGLITLDPAF